MVASGCRPRRHGKQSCSCVLVCAPDLVLQAVLNIISNPVNSTVPIAAETLKRMGVYDKRKLLGVTTLDVVSPKGPTHREGGGQPRGAVLSAGFLPLAICRSRASSVVLGQLYAHRQPPAPTSCRGHRRRASRIRMILVAFIRSAAAVFIHVCAGACQDLLC
jgi:hypothetical protein